MRNEFIFVSVLKSEQEKKKNAKTVFFEFCICIDISSPEIQVVKKVPGLFAVWKGAFMALGIKLIDGFYHL